ncbi:polyketide synthase dehydratase domain-containing protein, partial [Streptomyces sp. NPDC055506]
MGSLRRDEGGMERFATSVAQAYVHGADVDWTALLPGGQRVELPTYAFQRRRYWLEDARSAGSDPDALGLDAARHPVLGAAVELAEDQGVVLTGRLSASTHPWLLDHVVDGVVLLPGTAWVELAVRAGDEVGCGLVEELTLEAPLTIPENGTVAVQVRVGAEDPSGRRSLSVHSRPAGAREWTRYASGLLAPEPAGESFDLMVWPPAGAQPLALDGFYEDLAASGYGYGPVFRGLRAAWRRGEDVFAEVGLPEDQADGAAGFGIHPALLDAALHAGLASDRGDVRVRLPFTWNGVTLFAQGATNLRVHLSPAGPDTVSVRLADTEGRPVALVDALLTRTVAPGQLRQATSADQESLFAISWTPVSAGEPGGASAASGSSASSDSPVSSISSERWVVLGEGGLDVGPVPEFVVLPCVSVESGG